MAAEILLSISAVLNGRMRIRKKISSGWLAYLFCLVGVVNSFRISSAICVFSLVSLSSNPIAATAVTAAVWAVCVKLSGEPAVVYCQRSLRDAVGALLVDILIGEMKEGEAR